MIDEREPMRLSVRVSAELNDWLDAESKAMGIPKSAIVAFATEQYRQQKNISVNTPDMVSLLKTEVTEELKKV